MPFKKDFLWGAATASFQIEGAAFEDGKRPSVWDTFCREPNRVFGAHTGDVACDHYHRFYEDVGLMRTLGLKNYRFSIAWPRVIPEGEGAVNEKGLDYYDRLVDALLEAGIRPFATLFHWDYPIALYHRGAWANPDSPRWFAEYAQCVGRRLGDRVKDFIPLNEPQCCIGLGYGTGEHAPGLRLTPQDTVPMSHNLLLGAGLAARALRAAAPGCRIGYAPCADPAIPATDSPRDIEAARRSYFDVAGDDAHWALCASWWSDPVVLGHYPDAGLARFERYLPHGYQRDMDVICHKLDMYGQNIYNGRLVRAVDEAPGYAVAQQAPGAPRTSIGWFITPDALYWGPRFLYERYGIPFVIFENGMACHDAVSLDGKVHDPNRIDYMRRYLRAFQRAAEDGVDAAGYFAWSLLDNFEWAKGYHERFGLIHVDFATQKRTLKDSALWYSKVIAGGAF